MKGIISITQMEVIAGRPDINTAKIIREINKARNDGVSIIVFPEMAVPGYMLGDEWENHDFVIDTERFNESIRLSTKGITAIWGSVSTDSSNKNEDGRIRKFNSAFVASNGEWITNGVFVGKTHKTLLPKYREFDDERHFYSLRKLAQERGCHLSDLLKPFTLNVNEGKLKVGVILCEDMWCEDYGINPTQILATNGAEIIINLSCSPWTWRKNEKRHRVVGDILSHSPIPFLYCNNVGTQNNGKNIFLFDGSSSVYNKKGEVILTANQYEESRLDYNINCSYKPIHNESKDKDSDTEDLYRGLIYGIGHFFKTLGLNKVVIGLSGGIDSALSATLLTQALGKENIFAVNMPSRYNSDLTRNAASKLAMNLGIHYGVVPIQEVVDQTIMQIKGIPWDKEISTLVTENIQARDRGSRLLAGIASSLGAVFVNNGNKTETALGYATLYGDVDGAISIIGDLYKSEVYQLAMFLNNKANYDLIPNEILQVVPSAELSGDQDVTKGKGDPIIYPYHDKLVRAFVEFRMDPEQILCLYRSHRLEEELKIDKGLLAEVFTSDEDFINDLEHKWRLFKINVFKRIQSPPIIAVSKRAFGFDLRESQNGPYFTQGYKEIKEKILNGAT